MRDEQFAGQLSQLTHRLQFCDGWLLGRVRAAVVRVRCLFQSIATASTSATSTTVTIASATTSALAVASAAVLATTLAVAFATTLVAAARTALASGAAWQRI